MRALHWAARQDSAHMVRLLVAAGADVNATDGPGTTALEYGIPAGSPAAVQALNAAGANPERMRQPLTALVGPALDDEVPGARLEALVAAGANLGATDEKGRTARQNVEAWISSQRVASYRKTLEAVAAALRAAEGRR